jgi:anti-sigma-K factor RskA
MKNTTSYFLVRQDTYISQEYIISILRIEESAKLETKRSRRKDFRMKMEAIYYSEMSVYVPQCNPQDRTLHIKIN